MASSKGISQTLLITAQTFEAELPAEHVAVAIAKGVLGAGLPRPDLCPLTDEDESADLASALAADRFDARMQAARALVIAAPRLDERTLRRGVTFELATRARQGGVPCYAITAENAIDRFDARILDLQVVLEARSERALQAAGRRLAALV